MKEDTAERLPLDRGAHTAKGVFHGDKLERPFKRANGNVGDGENEGVVDKDDIISCCVIYDDS